jgi:hypothetical protein
MVQPSDGSGGLPVVRETAISLQHNHQEIPTAALAAVSGNPSACI